jgi:hypothetical protein
MKKTRFQFIWGRWRCAPEAEPNGDDPWARMRLLINGFNQHLFNTVIPGWLLIIDSSMCPWQAR